MEVMTKVRVEDSIILDVMSGDLGPEPAIIGANDAMKELGLKLILLGDDATILSIIRRKHCDELSAGIKAGQVEIIHGPDTILMTDSIKVVRTKTQASINIGIKLAGDSYYTDAADHSDSNKLSDKPSAFISAGHSGAVMTSAMLHMGRLKGIARPAIAVKLPTQTSTPESGGCVFLDSGAITECTPDNLRDFAVLGSLFARAESKSKSKNFLPRVGILSNGEEASKGTPLTRDAMKLISELSCFDARNSGDHTIGSFIGYVEGKELLKGNCDVVVTDGFTGNVVLKSLEGLGSSFVEFLKTEIKSSPMAMIGAAILSPVLRRLKRKLDYAEYGAAPLLGIKGYVFVCHGRSNARAYKNAILRTQTSLKNRYLAEFQELRLHSSERQAITQ